MKTLPPEAIEFIREAAHYLESPNLVHRLSRVIGKPLDKGLEKLPGTAKQVIHRASRKAIESALQASLTTLELTPKQLAFDKAISQTAETHFTHGAGTAVSGALGGFFGLPSMMLELPVTTTLMLRSIANVAANFGEDLREPQAQFECLYVFSMGGPSDIDDEVDTSYYTSRVVFAQAIQQALSFMAGASAREISKALETRSAPMVVELVVKVASRFEIQVGRKALTQLLPGIGAGLGALVNVAFMRHFNDTAKYHFGLRRLERDYGETEVRRLYQEEAKAVRAKHTS